MALTAEITRERNIAVLFTEHDMDVVFANADRIMVMTQLPGSTDIIPAVLVWAVSFIAVLAIAVPFRHRLSRAFTDRSSYGLAAVGSLIGVLVFEFVTDPIPFMAFIFALLAFMLPLDPKKS